MYIDVHIKKLQPKIYIDERCPMKLENVVFGYNPKRIKNSNLAWITDLR